ncbi:RNA polymerase sigma factor [Devosia insulae]|nr:sigma factor [Devosia insulae]
MRQSTYDQLLALARHCSRLPADADDLLQDALIEAIRVGRADFTRPEHRRWLVGVMRNKAKMAARGASRRRTRDSAWQETRPALPETDETPISALLTGLPPALKAVAALALSGHDRREIAYLLRLDEVTLRQRISTLGKRLRAAGLALPEGTPGLGLNLAYGRIRDALLPALLREGGIFASHDPDGHLFIVRRAPPG